MSVGQGNPKSKGSWLYIAVRQKGIQYFAVKLITIKNRVFAMLGAISNLSSESHFVHLRRSC